MKIVKVFNPPPMNQLILAIFVGYIAGGLIGWMLLKGAELLSLFLH